MGHRDAVRERVADARRCFGLVGQNQPSAGGIARKIHRERRDWWIGQIWTTRHCVHELFAAQDQIRWQMAMAQQVPWAIQIGQHGRDDAGALADRLLDRLPLLLGEEHRQGVQAPSERPVVRIGIDIEGGPVVADALDGTSPRGRELFGTSGIRQLGKPLPNRAYCAIGPDRLVEHSRCARVARE